jgi:cytochrome c biogenesis protein CcmG, thiol:disulfide interchange protein DsbE
VANAWKRPVHVVTVAVVLVLAGITGWRIYDAVREGRAAPKPAPGKAVPAPPLRLPRLNAPGELSLSGFRGRVVALNFWASWCLPCRDEAPLLERTWRENRAKGLVVLGVDANDASSDARAFVRKHGLSYPMVHDGAGATLGHWGVPGLPTTFVVDRRGRVVAKVLGGLRVGDNAASFRRDLARALATR